MEFDHLFKLDEALIDTELAAGKANFISFQLLQLMDEPKEKIEKLLIYATAKQFVHILVDYTHETTRLLKDVRTLCDKTIDDWREESQDKEG